MFLSWPRIHAEPVPMSMNSCSLIRIVQIACADATPNDSASSRTPQDACRRAQMPNECKPSLSCTGQVPQHETLLQAYALIRLAAITSFICGRGGGRRRQFLFHISLSMHKSETTGPRDLLAPGQRMVSPHLSCTSLSSSLSSTQVRQTFCCRHSGQRPVRGRT